MGTGLGFMTHHSPMYIYICITCLVGVLETLGDDTGARYTQTRDNSIMEQYCTIMMFVVIFMLTCDLCCVTRKVEEERVPRGEEDEEKRRNKLDRRYASGDDAQCPPLPTP